MPAFVKLTFYLTASQKQTAVQKTRQDIEDEFNPRAEESDKIPRDDNYDQTSSYQGDLYSRSSKSRGIGQDSDAMGSYSDQVEPQQPRVQSQSRHGRSRDDYRNNQQAYNEGQDERDSGRRRTSQESPRRHSIEHSEPRQHEKKERRRRQSGDIEGLREREDYMGQRFE